MLENSRMIPILRSVWVWGAGAALILLWAPLLALVRLLDRDPLRRSTGRWLRRLGRNLSRLNPWRLHISGREHVDPKQAYVVVSNHQSLADIPLISHIRIDAKWLGKAELFRLPVIGWMFGLAGDVAVERADRRKAAQSLLQCSRYLRQGCSIVFFPEGTRSQDGRVLPFNDGPFQLAIREQVPVLPLVVEGSGGCLPRNTWVFGDVQDIYLRVLEPVPVEGWNVKQTAELREKVRDRIIAELERMRAHATAV
jgi:1-acyl-sn-glycerol-3-phosphate acyltransferase